MKKILLGSLLTLVTLTGCGCNKVLVDTNYKFDTALVYEAGEWNEYKITKWNDYENDAICIWLKDGRMIYTHLENVILYNK